MCVGIEMIGQGYAKIIGMLSWLSCINFNLNDVGLDEKQLQVCPFIVKMAEKQKIIIFPESIKTYGFYEIF